MRNFHPSPASHQQPGIFRLFIHRSAILVLGVAAFLLAASERTLAERIVREQRTMGISGTTEVWQLVWEGKPTTACGPDDVAMAITCPCAGWAYAESGKLFLVRTRNGRDIERMDLRPVFGRFDQPATDGAALLQRWPLKHRDIDRANHGDKKLIAEIERRPAPQIMMVADYDRDGASTEFLVQVGTLPCGKLQFAAIGITSKDARLHALTSLARPDSPLVMPLAAWQALKKGQGPIAVPTSPCGDHGSESRSELLVSADDGAIRVKAREYSCPARGEAEKLISETDQ